MEPLDARLSSALFELTHSIAGHSSLDSLCKGLASALRHVISFDSFALVVLDPELGTLRFLGWDGPTPPPESPELIPPESTPVLAVFETQKPLFINDILKETRWPQFCNKVVQEPIRSVSLIPLTSGSRRLGVLGIGSTEPSELTPGEISFLLRVASELAVTVDAYLARQELRLERDRLRVLFDITNGLISRRAPDEFFSELSTQLARVLSFDVALVTELNPQRTHLQLYAVHFPGEFRAEVDHETWELANCPAAEAILTGRPICFNKEDLLNFPDPYHSKVLRYGIQAHCSLPLSTANGPLGTLEVARLHPQPFTLGEMQLLSQVARQIALALENAFAFKELGDLKDKLASEKLYLEDEIRSNENLGNMIGQSPAFQALQRSVQVVAPTDATVLILGETGTGKELIARAIHDLSPRRHCNFVKVNCAAIPATLIESELFGHEKGAFTGAIAQKTGRFELANRGTLFLDEIGEIPLELQAKLLRAIQEQEFERLGSSRTLRVDARIIAATNRDLKSMSEAGQFRSDLYYRLHVFPVLMPALRDRKEDIPLLVAHFAQKFARRMNRRIDSIPAPVMDALVRYPWPGNIRELQNVLERSVILSHTNELRVAMPELALSEPARTITRAEPVGELERERILQVLEECGGIVAGPEGAAARLGLKRTTLQSRMKKLGIARSFH